MEVVGLNTSGPLLALWLAFSRTELGRLQLLGPKGLLQLSPAPFVSIPS